VRTLAIYLTQGGCKINPIDRSAIHFFNQFAQRSWLFDRATGAITGNLLLTGGVVTALLWWAWIRNRRSGGVDRELVLSGLILSTVALAVARTFALLLPFRVRPRYFPEAQFHMPAVEPGFGLIHWSSFPSDHAVLYFSLATCLFLISRKVGVLAFCHATLFVCFPLIYQGAHYLTDVLAGALIGIGITGLASIPRFRKTIAHPTLYWLERSPRSFYPCMYLCTLLIATEFDSVRSVAYGVWKAVER
jgi:undecaprenyl-diphosphatase